MFEHKSYPLLPVQGFVKRQLRYFFYSSLVLSFSIGIGAMGYHFIAHLGWIDALLNASMILTGMGPVNVMVTDTAKVFASFYALYSGIVFLSTAAVMLAPAAHRLLHILQMDREDIDTES